MSGQGSLAGVLAALRQRFAASAGDTVAAFSRLGERLEGSPTSREELEALRIALHRVHGTAGSYGFHEASRLAAALEPVVLRWAADPTLDHERRGEVVRRFARLLEVALAMGPSGAPPTVSRVLLVGLADEVALPLVTEAIHRGHHVERTTGDGLAGLLAGAAPRAIIADARVAVPAPEGVALIRLVSAGEPTAADSQRSLLLDAATLPRDVMARLD